MENVPSQISEMRVLILSSTVRDFELTCAILGRAGIESCSCTDLVHLHKELQKGVGAVLIAEEALAADGDNPLFRYLKHQPAWSDLPILVLARPGADSAGVAIAMNDFGNVTVLERPTRIAALVSSVRSALRARTRQYQVRADAVALRAARDELEQRVRERTYELRSANESLEEKMHQTEAAEQRAHMLLRELVTAQENERARLARDLHDELGQQLTSLRLHLSQFESALADEPAVRLLLEKTIREAQRIDAEISFLAWKIRPTTVAEMGLPKALHGYLQEWSRNFDITAGFQANNLQERKFPPEIETSIYRIAQECLNNVAKYAEATEVSVLLSVDDDELKLIVEDNGKGFDPAASHRKGRGGGLGIKGMHERARLLNGTVQIEASVGKGTAVFVHVPAQLQSTAKAAKKV